MTFPSHYWADFIAVIAVVSLLYFSRREQRQLLGRLLVGLLCAFSVTFLITAIVGNKLAKTNVSVSVDNAEMQLRLFSAVSAAKGLLLKGAAPFVLTSPEQKHIVDRKIDRILGADSSRQPLAETEKALRAAMAEAPDASVYKIKLIVLLGSADRESHFVEIKRLIEKLQEAERSASVAKSASAPASSPASISTYPPLWRVLRAIYEERRVVDDVAVDRKAIETIPSGWFRDNAVLELYTVAHQDALYNRYKAQVEQRYAGTLFKGVFIGLIMMAGGLIGSINILIQLGMVAARPVPPPDPVGLNISTKALFVVFVSWFSIMLIVSMSARYLLTLVPDYAGNAVWVACGTALTYLIGNMSGPFLIYYLALKPQQLNFRNALQLRSRTSTAGPVKLVAAGFLAWCSAIPLIFLSAYISNRFLHTQGSDNPVIGQIVLAAGSASAFATFIFYITLGVMAPIFEEILFRGFFYAAVRPRIGAMPGILASAALFALLHFDKGGLLMLFAIGLVLGFTFEKTRSLVPCIIAHGLWNSGSFTVALVMFGS